MEPLTITNDGSAFALEFDVASLMQLVIEICSNDGSKNHCLAIESLQSEALLKCILYYS